MSSQCDIDGMCLDNKSKTKVVFGSKSVKLDEFDEMVKVDDRIKNKINMIDKELEKY